MLVYKALAVAMGLENTPDDDVTVQDQQDFDEAAFLAGKVPLVSGDRSRADQQPGTATCIAQINSTYSYVRPLDVRRNILHDTTSIND